MNTIAIVEIGEGKTKKANTIYIELEGKADWYYYDNYDTLEIQDLEEFYQEVIIV